MHKEKGMLKLSTATSQQDSSPPLRSERPLKSLKHHGILVVDDEVRIVELLHRELGRAYKVFTATSGEEALKILDKEPIVLVIADQRMPGMSGTELMERIVQSYPDIIRILLTGYTDLNALVDAINRGQVYRYISKPWEPEELKIIVQQSIERYELREENRFLIEDLKKKNIELRHALQELQKAQNELIRAERLSTIGKMANMIVHDFKNPLTSLLGMTDLLLTCRIDDEERKNQYYKIIRKETERIIQMVHEILEYVKGEGPVLNREHQDLQKFMEEVYQEIGHYLTGSGIEVQLGNVSPGSILLDEKHFRRVLYNLATNAREAMKEGGTLTLSVAVEQDHALFRVSDTGKGIPEQLQEKIFEPFFTTGKCTGLGLGLAIVKRIVESHKGEITIESSNENGTTFCIRIPLSYT
jgi:signal transduction histidine kinase